MSHPPTSAPCTVKAVIADMDGTLFDPYHRITPLTIQLLQQLRERGIAFLVATGRPYGDVLPTLARSGLEPDYIITGNGGRVHDRKLNVLVEHNMNPAAVLDIFQLKVQPNDDGSVDREHGQPKRFIVNVNHEAEWLTDQCLPAVRKNFDPSLVYQQVDASTYTADDLKGTHSMWLRGSHEDLVPVHQYIKKNLGEHVQSAFALPFILDCFPVGVNKGIALREVCGLAGIDLKHVAAFGDGMNDVQMLKESGYPFVMQNAAQDVKDAIPEATVIGSNGEEGVARKLQELLGL